MAAPSAPGPRRTPSFQDYANLLERYELLFKATHDVVYDMDLMSGRVQWNEALYDHYGYGRHEPVQTIEWWTAHIHPDDAMLLEDAFTIFLQGKQYNWEQEYRFRQANGHYVIIRDRGFVIRDAHGQALRIIGSFLDVTKERQLNRAKDEFISLASHQLKTPLSIIRTYTEMLTNGMLGKLTAEQTRHIRRITAATVRLIQLVNGILNIARFELDNLTVVHARIDLVKSLHDCIAEVQDHAYERGVRLSFMSPREPIVLSTDVVLLGQIVNNLLLNAINYSPEQSGRVVVRAARRGDACVISVRDNGIGIPTEDQRHIFDRFYRAGNAIDASEQGSGLGLYLVKLLAETLGGDVRFRTKLDHGTTFFVRLPLDD